MPPNFLIHLPRDLLKGGELWCAPYQNPFNKFYKFVLIISKMIITLCL